MKNIFQSLASFQQECPTIHKATKGYGYTYADLPTIFETINPLLAKHGLGFTQLIQGQQIKTILFHCESGETIESVTDIPQDVSLKGMNDFQVFGSACSYIRRYQISAICGIVTDKDIDASGEQQKKPIKVVKQTINEKTFDDYILKLQDEDDSKVASFIEWAEKHTLTASQRKAIDNLKK